MNKNITQIVPSLPPNFSGVGDYALRLAEYWPEHDVEWTWLVNIESECPVTIDRKSNIALLGATSAEVERSLDSCHSAHIILHYVPHGYERNGVPNHFVKALRNYKNHHRCRLVIVFHELYATGPFWTKTGVLSARARRLCRQLIEICDGWITSTPRYHGLALSMGGSTKPNRLIAVGPTIVPNDTVKKYLRKHKGEQGHWVVFGSEANRFRNLVSHETLIRSAWSDGKLEKLVLLGSAFSNTPEDYSLALRFGMPSECVMSVYNAKPYKVSEVLASCCLALIVTEKELAGKSSAAATCVAHGLKCLFPGDSLDDVCKVPSALHWPAWIEICEVVSGLLMDANALRLK